MGHNNDPKDAQEHESDFVLVVLSNNSNQSQWVQQEWYSKYWDEIAEGRVKVIPVLIEDCIIPELLKTKRYADFRKEYIIGFRELFLTLKQIEDSL